MPSNFIKTQAEVKIRKKYGIYKNFVFRIYFKYVILDFTSSGLTKKFRDILVFFKVKFQSGLKYYKQRF
jgi:hypothetical protein